MATAYLAIQESLGRPVVLKVLHTARSANPREVERFKKEGRIIASLNHPNIITVFDIDTAGDAVYLAMEYVEGGDLRKRMSGVLTPYEALDMLIKVGGALSAAHKKGIIHRDVKPAHPEPSLWPTSRAVTGLLPVDGHFVPGSVPGFVIVSPLPWWVFRAEPPVGYCPEHLPACSSPKPSS